MLCPGCGKENPNHAISCLSCGAPLVPGLKRVRAPEVEAAPVPSRGYRIAPLLTLLAVLLVLAGAWAYYTVHLAAKRAARAQRYQVLMTQVQSVSGDFDQTNQQVVTLLGQQPKNIPESQAFMRQLLALVDTYEQHIDQTTELLATIDREQLASSDAERNQIRVLQSVFQLRKQQANKLREMGNAILSFDPKNADLQQFQANLKQLEDQFAALDAQAKQQLSTVGFE